MERGDGPYLFDVDGNRYADFANHHTGQILGHRHPAVMAAIRAQLQRGIALGAPMGHETEACAELCSRVASLERARFTNSGTEASLHAVRLARAFTGRNLIAKFEGCYHGSHGLGGGLGRAAAGGGRARPTGRCPTRRRSACPPGRWPTRWSCRSATWRRPSA